MQYDEIRTTEVDPLDPKEISLLESAAPFDNNRMGLIAELSARLLNSTNQVPSLVAIGWWLRPGSIAAMERDFRQFEALERSTRHPIGVVTTVAPSNVDLLFAYSWALNFLLGNRQLVRVSSRSGLVDRQFLEAVRKTFGSVFNSSTIFFTSKRDSESLREAISVSNALLIWGSDETVRQFQVFNRPKESKFLSFPHRESSAVIESDALLELSDAAFRKFVKAFLRDTQTFDQQACSSPKKIFWVGHNSSQAINRFSQSLSSLVAPPPEVLSAKRTMSAVIQMMGGGKVQRSLGKSSSTNLIVGSKKELEIANQLNPGFSTYTHISILELAKLQDFIDPTEQTLVFFGNLGERILNELDPLRPLPKRVVPVGTALNFDYRWDGKNLITELTSPVFKV